MDEEEVLDFPYLHVLIHEKEKFMNKETSKKNGYCHSAYLQVWDGGKGSRCI